MTIRRTVDTMSNIVKLSTLHFDANNTINININIMLKIGKAMDDIETHDFMWMVICNKMIKRRVYIALDNNLTH